MFYLCVIFYIQTLLKHKLIKIYFFLSLSPSLSLSRSQLCSFYLYFSFFLPLFYPSSALLFIIFHLPFSLSIPTPSLSLSSVFTLSSWSASSTHKNSKQNSTRDKQRRDRLHGGTELINSAFTLHKRPQIWAWSGSIILHPLCLNHSPSTLPTRLDGLTGWRCKGLLGHSYLILPCVMAVLISQKI